LSGPDTTASPLAVTVILKVHIPDRHRSAGAYWLNNAASLNLAGLAYADVCWTGNAELFHSPHAAGRQSPGLGVTPEAPRRTPPRAGVSSGIPNASRDRCGTPASEMSLPYAVVFVVDRFRHRVSFRVCSDPNKGVKRHARRTWRYPFEHAVFDPDLNEDR